MYHNVAAAASTAEIKRSLVFSVLNFLLISAAFFTTVKLIPEKLPQKKHDPFLLKHFNIILLIIFILTIIKFVLIAFENTGIKNDADRDTTFAFVLRLLSPELTFYICYVYIKKYWRDISVRKKSLILLVILITCTSVLLTGSKIFLALFGVCIFLNLLYENKKIKIAWALSLTIIALAAVVFSFAMAFAIKYSSTKDMASVLTKAQTYTNSKDYLAIGDAITQRMIGLDGQIAIYNIQEQSNKRIDNALKNSFSIKQLTLHTIEDILPKIKLSEAPNTGKAISENIVGLSADVSHGGSLGLFASIMVTCGSYFFLFDIGLGIFLALYFIYVRRIKSDDLRFILFAIGGYFIMRLVLSGNFDIIVSEFATEWIMLFLYIKLLQVLKL